MGKHTCCHSCYDLHLQAPRPLFVGAGRRCASHLAGPGVTPPPRPAVAERPGSSASYGACRRAGRRYCNGGNLADRVAKRPLLGWGEIVAYGRDILDGLQARRRGRARSPAKPCALRATDLRGPRSPRALHPPRPRPVTRPVRCPPAGAATPRPHARRREACQPSFARTKWRVEGSHRRLGSAGRRGQRTTPRPAGPVPCAARHVTPRPPAYTKPARREWTALGPLRVRHRPQQTHGQGDRSAPASAWRTGGWAMRRGPVPAEPHGVVPMRRRGHGKLFISGGS